MFDTKPGLMTEIRDRFAHVDHCPMAGDRIFFENAGGALTLKSVVQKSSEMAAIPDNQGRDNEASHELVRIINTAKEDTRRFFNAKGGQIFVGESGTELLFRLITVACLGTEEGGSVMGSSLEHPASRSACVRWSKIAGKNYVSVPHDDASGTVTADAYAAMVTPDTRVATILHTSPVTGMSVDVAAVSKAIRAVSSDCIIIVDGIQHAAHGALDLAAYSIDGYVISPYKVFSRHGYGMAWISDRLSALPHDMLIDAPAGTWELGTRDTGSYATFSDVVGYFEWLGSNFTESTDKRDQLEAAAVAIHAHEKSLTEAMLHGTGNLKGLADLPNVGIVGGVDNPAREGLVSMYIKGRASGEIVSALREQGIRVHIRKADHYSGNILTPLGLDDCIRVSLCHYNTEQEVAQFLGAMQSLSA